MPIVVNHEDQVLAATDNGRSDQIQPSHWRKPHVVELSALLEILDALSPGVKKGLRILSGSTGETFDFSDFMASLMGSADSAALGAAAGLLSAAGATMTGTLTLAADPILALQAATKQYVDAVASGFDPKQSARAASTANVNIASAPASLDTITGVAGDRWFLKNQTAPAENGLYVFSAAGAALVRAADFDAWSEIPGASFWVEEGATNADTAWVCTSNAGGTLGTTAITFVQQYGAGLFQPSNANLSALAAFAASNPDTILNFNGAGTLIASTLGAGALTFLAQTTSAARRANLGVDVANINFIIDGGGSVITTGIKGDILIPFACTITEWTLLGDQIGNIVVDVWLDTYGNFPPVVSDSITAAAKPTMSGGVLKNQSSTLTGWTTAIPAGTILRFNVDSVATLTRATLVLKVLR